MIFLIQKNKAKAFYFFAKRRKIVLLIFISITISILYTILVNNKYEETYKKIPQNLTIIATVVSEPKETDYYYSYEVKVNNKKFIMYAKKDNQQKLKYGMSILADAEYTEPDEARNYKGFSYRDYLKTRKIYGSFKASEISIIKENDVNIFMQYSNKLRNKIIRITKEILPEDTEGLMVGILIGENSGISDKISENFRKSSLSHIVAISGSHITYIIVGVSFILTKSKIPRRGMHIITIIFLIIFMFITRFSPSIVRACIMGIIMLFSKVVYRKPDILNSIALSLLIILIDNPFAIMDIGLQLSYLGTIGIIFLNKPILEFLKKHMNKKIAEVLSVTISAQIAVIPIIAVNFNTISTVFIISNLLAVPLSGAITLFGYANVFIGMIFIELAKKIGFILNILANLLILIAEMTAKIPFATIVVITPSIILIIVYYIAIYIFLKENRKQLINKLIDLLKKVREKKILRIVICIVITVIILVNTIPKDLKVYFIDVGQRRLYTYTNSIWKKYFNRHRRS